MSVTSLDVAPLPWKGTFWLFFSTAARFAPCLDASSELGQKIPVNIALPRGNATQYIATQTA